MYRTSEATVKTVFYMSCWKAFGGLGLGEWYDLMKVLELTLTFMLKIECGGARIEARRPVRKLVQDPSKRQWWSDLDE